MRPIIGVVARPYMTDNGRYAMPRNIIFSANVSF